MRVLVEGPRSVWLGAEAWLVDGSRELAWAENLIVDNPAYRWVLGRYVEANQPNDNGHVFDLDDLRASQPSLVHAPLNMIHRADRVVGCYVGSELIYPVAGDPGAGAPLAAAATTNPYMEALAAFYKYYFPDELAQIEAAHNQGSLFFSMEAVPSSLTCLHADCNKEFPYQGRRSPAYCGHLNELAARRRLNKPHFVGGALIIPPVTPAWRRADITELSKLLETHALEAEMAHNAIAELTPNAEPSAWEQAMFLVMLAAAAEDAEAEMARDFSTDKRKQLAKQGKALPDGSYPIESVKDLKNAITLAKSGHGDVTAAKAHIKKRAKSLGVEDLVPPEWSGSAEGDD